MVALRLLNSRVGPKASKRVWLILSSALIGFLVCSQNAVASSWAVEKFEVYQQHPDWVNTRCQNMVKVNGKGLSNFTEKVAMMEKGVSPPVPVAAIVIDPPPLVMDTPVPAVKVDFVSKI